MAATKSLMSGQWGQAYEYLAALTVWPLIGGVRKDDVLAMLRTKLQVRFRTAHHQPLAVPLVAPAATACHHATLECCRDGMLAMLKQDWVAHQATAQG